MRLFKFPDLSPAGFAQPDQDEAVSLKVTKPKGVAFSPQVTYNVSDHPYKDDFVESIMP